MKNTSKPAQKPMERDALRISGSLCGKFAIVLIGKEAIEVRTLSTALLIIMLWLTAFVIFFLSGFLLGNLFWAGLIALIGGLVGFIVMLKFYRGKLDRRMEYPQIASFVRDDSEFFINLSNNYMYSIRLSTRKQEYLMDCVTEKLQDNPDFTITRMGKYLKLHSVKEKPEAVSPAPKSKK